MPIVLATFSVVAGVPGSDRLVDLVFVLVMIFTLVPGPSLRPLARLLRLIPADTTREIQIEAAPLDVLDAELLTFTIPSGSQLHHVTITELLIVTIPAEHEVTERRLRAVSRRGKLAHWYGDTAP